MRILPAESGAEEGEKVTVMERVDHLQSLSGRRLNIGSGQHPLRYWTNLDESQDALADVRYHVPPLRYADESLDEIYAGHFLEHLTPAEADEFVRECFRCLTHGGKLGIVVPDTREVVQRYLRGDIDEIEFPRGVWRPINNLNTLCDLFFYSTVQESPHRWSYDTDTLGTLLVRHGFELVKPINRFSDPRIPVGAWYQCGLDAVKR